MVLTFFHFQHFLENNFWEQAEAWELALAHIMSWVIVALVCYNLSLEWKQFKAAEGLKNYFTDKTYYIDMQNILDLF